MALIVRFAGVTLIDTSLAVARGLGVGKFFTDIGSTVGNWIKDGLGNIGSLLSNMAGGAAELFGAIARGDWSIFGKWLDENPIAAVAGAGAVLLIGGTVVALAASGIAAIAGIVGTGATLWGITGGACLTAAVGAVATIYNFDFNKSDDALEAEVNAAFTGLANVAGNALGRAIAGIIVNQGASPKLKIDVKQTATMCLALEDDGEHELAQTILQELSGLCHAFCRFARQALFTVGYINFRKWARQNVHSGIEWIDKMIASWGTESGKPWIISAEVNKFTAKVTEKDVALGNFLQGAISGFGGGLQEFLVLEYH